MAARRQPTRTALIRERLGSWLWAVPNWIGSLRPFRPLWGYIILGPKESRNLKALSRALRLFVYKSVTRLGGATHGSWRFEMESGGQSFSLRLLPTEVLFDYGDGIIASGNFETLLRFTVDDSGNHVTSGRVNVRFPVADGMEPAHFARAVNDMTASLRSRVDSPRIHRPPGWALRRWARDFYSRRTFERVIEPTLVDLEVEYQEALAEQRLGKARWKRAIHYYAFWSTVVALALTGTLKKLVDLWKILRGS